MSAPRAPTRRASAERLVTSRERTRELQVLAFDAFALGVPADLLPKHALAAGAVTKAEARQVLPGIVAAMLEEFHAVFAGHRGEQRRRAASTAVAVFTTVEAAARLAADDVGRISVLDAIERMPPEAAEPAAKMWANARRLLARSLRVRLPSPPAASG